jgi:regulator of RNase E activity RraA
MSDDRTTRISDEVADKFRKTCTATVSSVLSKLGFNRMFLEEIKPLRPDLKLVGQAYTLRYVPTRPDIASAGATDNTTNQQRIAIESVGPGDVLVIEARGNISAGTLGDILATRVWARGAAGIVCDGAFRDTPAVAEVEMPTYSRSQNPNMSGAVHYPVEINGVITCAGVAVLPGDVIFGDAEGVMVIPVDLAEQVANEAVEQEEREAFILEKIRSGSSIHGVYPPNEETLAEFERSRKQS